MNFQPLYVVFIALARSVIGWLQNSLEDKKIQDYEWRLLISTVIRVGFFGVIVAYFPGLNLSWLDASMVAIAADFIFSAIKKVSKK